VLIGELLRLNKNDEPIALVTFNYDLLLDRALETFGYQPQVPESPLEGHHILKEFKPMALSTGPESLSLRLTETSCPRTSLRW
jgi:hypothetical protein